MYLNDCHRAVQMAPDPCKELKIIKEQKAPVVYTVIYLLFSVARVLFFRVFFSL